VHSITFWNPAQLAIGVINLTAHKGTSIISSAGR
jgi:hypothetical protein